MPAYGSPNISSPSGCAEGFGREVKAVGKSPREEFRQRATAAEAACAAAQAEARSEASRLKRAVREAKAQAVEARKATEEERRAAREAIGR